MCETQAWTKNGKEYKWLLITKELLDSWWQKKNTKLKETYILYTEHSPQIKHYRSVQEMRVFIYMYVCTSILNKCTWDLLDDIFWNLHCAYKYVPLMSIPWRWNRPHVHIQVFCGWWNAKRKIIITQNG